MRRMLERMIATLIVSLFACPDCRAAEVIVDVVNSAGHPVQDAVVTLTPDEPVSPSAKIPGPPKNAVIDQRNETFVPLVTVLPQGGRLIFRNSDTVLHHVYSFSQIKQFQFVLSPGAVSTPVIFDKTGLAAIGCNIHDHMIAYVVASASPWAAISDRDGKVRFEAVPTGMSQLEIWHPELAPGVKPVHQSVDVGSEAKEVSATLNLAPPHPRSPHQMDY